MRIPSLLTFVFPWLSLLIAIGLPVQAQVAFSPGVNYPIGDGPIALVQGDFNGDGAADIATANFDSSTVTVLLNNGNATLGTPATLLVGLQPSAMVATDLDQDGDLDLAVTTSGLSGQFYILLNDGAGVFTPRRITGSSSALGTFISGINSADFDGDGDQDLAFTSLDRNTVSIFLNNGAAAFTILGNPILVGLGPNDLASGDLDGDGDLDLVTADVDNGTISVLLNNGDGTFGNSTRLTIVSGSNPYALLLRDLNADGTLDVAITDQASSNVFVLLGNGNATFGSPNSYQVAKDPVGLDIADINSDGILDIITANGGFSFDQDGQFSVIFGNGDGTFSVPSLNTLVPSGPVDVVAVDMDGDGDTDVITANFDANNLTVIRNITGQSTPLITSFTPTAGLVDTEVVLLGTNFTGATAVTFNGIAATFTVNTDTQITTAVPTGATSGRIEVTTPSGVATSPADFFVSNIFFVRDKDYEVGSVPTGLIKADLNGDGFIDLATANQVGDNVSVLLNDGSGTFLPSVNYLAGSTSISLAAADFDQDGAIDLVTADFETDTVTVLFNNGDGTFAAGLSLPLDNGDVITRPTGISSGDLNNDGIPDLVTVNLVSDSVTIVLSNGDRTFAAPITIPVSDTLVAIQVGLLNQDNFLDIIVATDSDTDSEDGVTILLNNGDGTFLLSSKFGTGPDPASIVLSDVDLDGDNDVITANKGLNTVSVLLNNGSGTLATKVDYIAGNGPFGVTSDDVDGDGDQDIITTIRLENTVAVLLNRGNGTFDPAVVFPVGIQPVAVVAAPLDADTDLDLAVANLNSDTVTVLLNNSSQDLGTIITSFSPNNGPEGTVVTVFGSGFIGATSVQFNGLEAVFAVEANGRLTATVPVGATTGPITVITPTGTGVSSQSFVVAVPINPTFTVEPTTRSTRQGKTIGYGLVVDRDGFIGPLTPFVRGLPPKTTGTFITSTVLSITTTSSTPVGVYELVLGLTGRDVTVPTVVVTLEITGPPTVTNISDSVNVTTSGLVDTTVVRQQLTVINTSGQDLVGPLYLSLENLTPGVTLKTPTQGTTRARDPLILALKPGVILANGLASPGITLEFENPTTNAIVYVARLRDQYLNQVTGQISRGGFINSARVRQQVTVRNTTGSEITGPLYLGIDGLTPGAIVVGAASVAPDTGGVLVALDPINLDAESTVTLLLEFENPTPNPLTYTLRVLQSEPLNRPRRPFKEATIGPRSTLKGTPDLGQQRPGLRSVGSRSSKKVGFPKQVRRSNEPKGQGLPKVTLPLARPNVQD